jgi:hypothetical protein
MAATLAAALAESGNWQAALRWRPVLFHAGLQANTAVFLAQGGIVKDDVD